MDPKFHRYLCFSTFSWLVLVFSFWGAMGYGLPQQTHPDGFVDTTMSVTSLAQWQGLIRQTMGPDSLNTMLFFLATLQDSTARADEHSFRLMTFPSDSGAILPMFSSISRLHRCMETVLEKDQRVRKNTNRYGIRKYSLKTLPDLLNMARRLSVSGFVLDHCGLYKDSTISPYKLAALSDSKLALSLWINGRASTSFLVDRLSRRSAKEIMQGHLDEAKQSLRQLDELAPEEPRVLAMGGLCGLLLKDSATVKGVDEYLKHVDPLGEQSYRQRILEKMYKNISKDDITSLINFAVSIPISSARFGDK